jgi:alpha-L-arabinofuranosidase
MLLTPTYHVMEMYNVHQDALMLPLTVTGNDYKMGIEKLKAVSASASRDKNGVTHISLVNVDANNAQDISIDVNGASFKTVTGRILTSDKIQNYNSFDNPDKIKPAAYTGAGISGNELKVKIPAFSVVVVELK